MLGTIGKVALASIPLLIPLMVGSATAAAQEIGSTEILRWQGGRQAAMTVTLDDQLNSQRDFAVPELEKRHLQATFFLNPGDSRFTSTSKTFWQDEFPKLGHEYGVHTMLHRATDATVDADLAQCVAILSKIHPNSTPLMSFAMPGGKDPSGTPVWNVTKAVGDAALAKHNLVSRDEKMRIYIPGTSVDDLKKWVDNVIASGGFEKICFHGVGGDWIPVPVDVFTGYLDYLVAKRDQLWVAPHIVIAKYAKEFGTAKATAKPVGDTIEVTLTTEADPALYDQPLTLQTRVPADWTSCQVTQGKTEATAKVADGVVRYDARPSSGTIVLKKASAGHQKRQE